MSDMPEVIAKGPILEKLEDVFNKAAGRPARRTAILNALKKDPPTEDLLTLADKHMTPKLKPGQRYHIQQQWLTDPNWLVQPVEPIVRKALSVALEKAGAATPIDCYWVCHPSHGGAAPPASPEPLEVSISWYGKQVTVIFYTPEPLNPPAASTLTTTEDIVVVKRGGSGAPVVVPVLHS